MATINGTAGNDTLTGTIDADTINGLAGDDSLHGAAGDDTVYGSDGDDQLWGDDGNDILDAGTGVDTLDGGAGDDFLVVGGGGTKTLVGGIGFDTVTFAVATAAVTVDLGTTDFQLTFTGETDAFTSVEKLIGSIYDDHFTGAAAGETFLGGAGNDILNGGAGDDTLWGQAGTDILNGGAGDDTLDSGFNGTSYTTYEAHRPFYHIGDSGHNQLFGGDGADTLSGGATDTLDGGDGDDTINAISPYAYGFNTLVIDGPVTIVGGNGSDQITLVGYSGTIDAGAGADRVTLKNTFGSAGTLTITTGAGGDIVDLQTHQYQVIITDFTATGADFDRVLLGPFAYRDTDSDARLGQQGADTVIFTEDGRNSTIIARLSGVDATTLTGANFAEFGSISIGVVSTVGTDGGDVMQGTAGDDSLFGLRGADTLVGGAGDDDLRGGLGDDLLKPGEGSNTGSGDGGIDTLSYEDSAIALQLVADYVIDVTHGGGTDHFYGIEHVIGSSANDTLTGGSALASPGYNQTMPYTLDGGAGDDTITAGSAALIMRGGAGNDTLIGGAAADSLTGGAGADQLTGGGGSDTFIFGLGDSVAGAADSISDFVGYTDLLDLTALAPAVVSILDYGGSALVFAKDAAGNDVLQLGVNGSLTANDILTGVDNFGFDIVGQAATNTLTGGSGADNIYGAAGDDTLSGGLGDDLLVGSGGADILLGGGGGDTLTGGDGADILLGGSGGDYLTGGAGADIFRYTQALDSTSAGQDVITDFVSGVDKIELNLSVTEVSLVRLGSATFIFANTPNGAMQIGVNSDVNISDLVLQTPRGVYLIGDGDSETLTGGALNDVIQAGDGVDLVTGGGGGDALWGGTGSDTFKYLLASDSNAAGADTIFDFQTGSDKIDLTGLAPTEVSIVRSGGSSFLFINGPGGASQLAATSDVNASDLVLGSNLSTYVIGDDAANSLVSGAQTDILQGGGGADTLTGGGLSDLMWGGAGADVFKYLTATDSNAAGADSIFDFQSGADKLDLSAVRTGASDALGWISSGGSTFVFVDLHGDGVGDMVIQLTNTASFTANDYIF